MTVDLVRRMEIDGRLATVDLLWSVVGSGYGHFTVDGPLGDGAVRPSPGSPISDARPWWSRTENRAHGRTHNTCVTTRMALKLLKRTQATTGPAGQAPDQDFFVALARRRPGGSSPSALTVVTMHPPAHGDRGPSPLSSPGFGKGWS